VSTSSTPPDPSLAHGQPPDSEPSAPPSIPNTGLWSEQELAAPGSVAFPTTVQDQLGDSMNTIGHIGRYALKYRIGEGGLGTVYAAHDPLLSRLIAIKTLNVEIAAEQRSAFNALFLNEARAAAGLSHPHIVTVFDAGVSDDNAYIAMELLKGRDLRQLRQEGWRPTPTQAALVVRRVADALAYAHSKGVVHRDIKPANIFMVGRTQPRVLDFGIARVAHQHEAHAGDDVAAGSPYYMSPEQVRNQPGDRRTDVFSLGVVLYELLTDQRPFRGATLAEITHAVLEHEPPLAHTVNPEVPKSLAEIAARAMEKDPEHRFRSARALSRELRHWIDEHGQPLDGPETSAAGGDKRALWAGAVAAGVILAAAGLWAGLSGGPSHDSAVAATTAASVAPAPTAGSGVTLPGGASAATLSAPAAGGSALDTAAANAALTPVAALPAEEAKPVKPVARPSPQRTRVAKSAVAAPLASGVVRLAISPWGQVEVDGAAVGTAPPLTELKLTEGRHRVTIRNADFPPYSASVNVTAGQPVTLKHRFGS